MRDLLGADTGPAPLNSHTLPPATAGADTTTPVCGTADPDGPAWATCVRPAAHDAAREGHSAPLGERQGEWDWHHWPDR